MVTIRLSRTGRKNAVYYRVVVADQRRKRDGKIIERVGNYNPRDQQSLLTLKKERIEYWIGKGAQPTPTVAKLIKLTAKAPKPATAAR